MRVQPVDERDSNGEDDQPRFRVYAFRGGDEPMRSWSTATGDEQRSLDAMHERRAEYRREHAEREGRHGV